MQWLVALGGLLLMVPLVHSLYLTHRYVDELREEDLAEVPRQLDDAVREVGERVARLQSILETLADSDQALNGDWRRLHAYARRVARENSLLLAVTLIDRNGTLVFGTARAFGEASPPAAQTENVRHVFATAQAALSGPFRAPCTGITTPGWLVAISVPVIRHGQVTHVLRGIVPAESLQEILRSLRLPEGWLAVITDRAGNLIARSIPMANTVGRPVLRPILDVIRAGQPDSLRQVSREGIDHLVRVGFLPKGDWSVQVGVAEARVTARSGEALRQTYTVYALILLGTLLAGWAASRRLGKALRGIVTSAETASRGRPAAAPPTGIRELDRLQAEIHRLAVAQRQLLDEALDQAVHLARTRDALAHAQGVARLGSFELDPATGTVSWSEALFRIHGIAPDSPAPGFAEQAARGLLTGEAKALPREIGDAIAAGHDIDREYRILRPDGTERLVRTMARPEYVADGTLLRYAGTTLDITEARAAEDAGRRSLEEIARLHRLNTANALANTLAHELNQPLATIANYATVCRQQMAKPSPDLSVLRETVGRIAAQALRAGEVIHTMRRLIAQGTITPTAIDLGALIRDTGELMAPALRSQRIRLTCDLAPGLPPVRGIKVQVEQVLLNLLRNACDALVATAAPDGQIMVIARATEGTVLITLRDNGPGIPAEQAATLFDGLGSRKSGGLGLGLSISRGLVEAHGGQLWVEPQVPGAIFHITLQAADPPAAS